MSSPDAVGAAETDTELVVKFEPKEAPVPAAADAAYSDRLKYLAGGRLLGGWQL
jgi:hypothetical protein